MTYSLDFRKKALSIRSREKLSFAQTAKRFGVSVNSLFLWSKQIEPKQTKNRPAIKIDKETLMEDIEIWWSQTSRPKFVKVKLVFPDVKFSSYSFFRTQGLIHNRSLTASDIPNSGDGAVHYKTQNKPLVHFLVL